jgi:putative zinc finger protein
MACYRIDLHRLFPLYLDGAASPSITRRLEKHLLDCSGCRARLVRMREAKKLLGALPPVAAIPFERLNLRPHTRVARLFVVPSIVRHFAADALVATALFIGFTLLYTHTASARNRLFDSSSFRALAIRAVASTHDPHVIVQGVVATLPGDDDDEGSHRFRLSDPNDPKAFVVCEILDGDTSLRVPKSGSRVRVWGVSRYDSSPDHQWSEIHPVLRVEILP